MQTKFKSAINAAFLTVFCVFNLVILLLLTSKIFVTVYTGVYFGIFLLIIDLLFFVPMFFVTGYEFTDDYLIVRDWPFKKYKIAYDDMFSIEEGDYEAKNKHIVALSMNRIALGYTEKKKDEEKKTYIYISPAEMSLFLIRLVGRLKQSEIEIEEKAKKISAEQAEHEKKKKQWQKEKEKIKKEKQPEIIKVDKTTIDKFSGFEESDKENKSDKK